MYYVQRLLCYNALCLAIYTAVCYTITFPLALLMDIFFLIFCLVFVLPLLFLVLVPVELALLFFGLCYYRCQRLKESGVFALKWKLKLISSVQTQQFGLQTLIITYFDTAVDVSLPRVSLCRSIFCNRVAGIFHGIYWHSYSYGNIDNVEHLTAEEVQMYEVLKRTNPKL